MAVEVRVERNVFTVAEPCSVTVEVRTEEDLRPGQAVECQFPNSWLLVRGPSYTRRLQCDDPAGEHYVSVDTPARHAFDVSILPRHLCFPAVPGRHGRLIKAVPADEAVPAGTPIFIRYQNTFAPYIAETEHLWVRVAGREPETLPALVTLPGPGERLRIIAPSVVEPGEEFPVLVVSLDRFDNRSSSSFSGKVLRTPGGRILKRHVSFTGAVRVPVRLEEEGVHRILMDDTLSNPILVKRDGKKVFWGDIHIHTKLSGDGQGSDPYGYARDVSGLDFAAVTDHCEDLGEEGHACTVEWAEEAYVPGKFVTLFGDERNPASGTGHHNIYFRTREAFEKYRVHYPPGDPAHPDKREKELGRMPPEDVLLVPHHTGIAWRAMPREGIGSAVDWNALKGKVERSVVEIYSHHGQSETYCPQHVLSYEFNRMRKPGRRSNISFPGPYYAEDYLAAGERIRFIASSDEHTGQGGRPHGGITALFAPELTRDAVFAALRAGRCYATTGERILLEFTAAGEPMGGVVKVPRGEEIELVLRVWGTNTLLLVEIIRFRSGGDKRCMPFVAFSPRPETMDASITVTDRVETDTLYYARVTQEPLEWPDMAWSSPVWVEVGE